MKTRKILGIIITLAMVISLFPTILVSAEETKPHVPFMFYDETVKEMKEGVCTDYVLLDGDTKTWEGGKWYVAEGELTLDGRVWVLDEAYLILKDGCKLTVSEGISVSEGSSLTIYAQSEGENMGALISTGLEGSAGIGGAGKVTIYGGNIKAYGADGGAGIGSGYFELEYEDSDVFVYIINKKGTAGSIKIYGGNITATGGYSSAGIG